MKRLIIAFRAFSAIIIGNPHVFCRIYDNNRFTHSIDCQSNEYIEMTDYLDRKAWDSYNQELLVNEAKEIMETKIK